MVSNQKLQSRSVFARPRDPLRPTDLHEGGDVHGNVGQREHTTYDGVLWQRPFGQHADTPPADILGHPVEQVARLLQDISASEQTNTQFYGVGKAWRCPVVHDFSPRHGQMFHKAENDFVVSGVRQFHEGISLPAGSPMGESETRCQNSK